jgi:hypothetical protein
MRPGFDVGGDVVEGEGSVPEISESEAHDAARAAISATMNDRRDIWFMFL